MLKPRKTLGYVKIMGANQRKVKYIFYSIINLNNLVSLTENIILSLKV